jgi:hypothetical protein
MHDLLPPLHDQRLVPAIVFRLSLQSDRRDIFLVLDQPTRNHLGKEKRDRDHHEDHDDPLKQAAEQKADHAISARVAVDKGMARL